MISPSPLTIVSLRLDRARGVDARAVLGEKRAVSRGLGVARGGRNMERGRRGDVEGRSLEAESVGAGDAERDHVYASRRRGVANMRELVESIDCAQDDTGRVFSLSFWAAEVINADGKTQVDTAIRVRRLTEDPIRFRGVDFAEWAVRLRCALSVDHMHSLDPKGDARAVYKTE
jgi:hypothetical protein